MARTQNDPSTSRPIVFACCSFERSPPTVSVSQAVPDRPMQRRGDVSTQKALLATMPSDTQARLLAQAQTVAVPARTVLCEFGDPSDYAYFPRNGMVSLLSMTEDGDTVEVATVGREGMLGLPSLMRTQHTAYQANVQLPTQLLRISADALKRELSKVPALHGIFIEYAQRLFAQGAQNALCYRFHTGRQRLCRWLLTARDRADGDTLALTQELLAQTLGLPRTGVTAVAVVLQDAGAIRCRHGRITILNRTPLMARTCESYQVLRDDLHAQTAALR